MKRILAILLALSLVLTLTPVSTWAASKPELYKPTTEELPFRLEEDGTIVGEIDGGTVLEVLSYKPGGYAKVKWNGGQVYVWADKLKKVSAPDAVCSSWAQKWMSASDGEYVGIKGQWAGAGKNYTEIINRKDMADYFVKFMSDIYGDWAVKFTLPIVHTDSGKYWDLNEKIGFTPGRLVYWDVTPYSYYSKTTLKKQVTYGEVTKYLKRLIQYDNRGSNYKLTLTDSVIKSFKIGGDTSSTAKCTEEQIRVLCEKTLNWYNKKHLQHGAALEKKTASTKRYKGLRQFASGTFTIQSFLENSGKNPYVVMNSEGKAELSRSKSQKYKVTYCGRDLRGHYYTIKTMDGKYLALDGTATNGSRLMTRTDSYRWYINSVTDGHMLFSKENGCQALNASGWNTKDGTAIISWIWNHGTGNDNNNYKFYFEYAN